MQLYTFYPCDCEGSAETFVVFELASDQEAQVRALQVLDQHPSCARVVVWCGDRKVLTRDRSQTRLWLAPDQDRPAALDS
jgi:hypothetical protein